MSYALLCESQQIFKLTPDPRTVFLLHTSHLPAVQMQVKVTHSNNQEVLGFIHVFVFKRFHKFKTEKSQGITS